MRISITPARGFAALLIGFGCLGSNTAPADVTTLESPATLGSIVVTGTRTPTSPGDSLASVTVLSREDIDARQALSMQDLLQGEAGLQISNNGGLGKVSSIFLRGANADQVLVLVDGVRLGSATTGTTAFQYLPLDQIGRVEIVRGPLSSLYGSEAMGGVIQIFTRRPSADGATFEADAAGGSHDTNSIGASIGVSSGPISYALSASNLSSNGYANCRGAPATATSPGGGCFVFDSAPDGFHNLSGSARLGYRFSNTADVEAQIMRAQGGTRYAGTYTNHEDFVEQVASLAGHWSPIAALRLTAQLGQSYDNELDSLDFVAPPGNLFDTRKYNASLQADWHITATQLFTAGSDYVRDQISSDTFFPVTTRNITGVYGEYQTTWGPEQLTLSARHDSDSQFFGKTTGTAAWGYHFAQNLRLSASVGSAFHAPSFDDLYFPGFGNPALKPETSRALDIGLEQRSARAQWSVHAFESRVRDLISFDATQNAPENTDRARIRGVELQGGVKAGPWSGNLTATWLDARNLTAGSANADNWLPRRARSTGRLEVARQWLYLKVAGRLNLAGPSFEDLANTESLGGYTTIDALLEWTPARAWTVQAKIANATDHRYETALFYPQDRRNFLVTIRYRSGRS